MNGKQAKLDALKERGIAGHALAEFHDTDPAVITAACRWFDAQHGRVGPAVLVDELRRGRGVRESVMDRQWEYGEQIVAWLRKHFPQWHREQGNRTHTAAIAEVIRLHHRHGKGRLTKREHGPAIRAAVKRWEEQT